MWGSFSHMETPVSLNECFTDLFVAMSIIIIIIIITVLITHFASLNAFTIVRKNIKQRMPIT